MSIGQTLAEARKKAKAIREARSEEKRSTVLSNMIRKTRELNKTLSSELEMLTKELDDYKAKEEAVNDAIIQDIIIHKTDAKAEYSDELISLAAEIKSISPKAYNLLIKRLHFPKEKFIDNKTKEIISDLPEQLVSIDKAAEVMNNYRETNKIKKSAPIQACIAVDAIYFDPEVKFCKNGFVEGCIFPHDQKVTISQKSFSMFSKDPKQLERFITLNAEHFVRAGFVFQIQPYDIRYKPFVVHIIPSVNGKANKGIIDALEQIRTVAKNRNFIIKTYAFDGDNAYHELHKIYYESYINKAIKEHRISEDKSRTFRVVSDFLHIIKRLRYRLLSSLIHSGFTTDDPVISIDDLKTILQDMPEIVWNNEKFTKMHDRLPLELFKIDNFIKLFIAGHYTAAAFWFPISLSILAINGADLGFQYRYYLLQAAFWFLVFYKEQWEDAEFCNLKQRKWKGENDVLFYTKDILIEFTNTLHSHIQLMNTIPNYCYDRNSTTPLEHKFGNVRLRVKEKHTIAKFIQTIGILQSIEAQSQKLTEFQSFQEDLKIHGRTSSFGVTVESKTTDENIYSIYDEDDDRSLRSEFFYTPQAFAKSILLYAGFDVKYSDMIEPDDVINFGIDLLTELTGDQPMKRKQKRISMNSVTFGIKNQSIAQNRMHAKIPKREQKKACINEFLIEKFGSQYTKNHIRMVFEAIAQATNPPKLPKFTASKEKLIDFLTDHIGPY